MNAVPEPCRMLYKKAIEPIIPEEETRINVAMIDKSTLQLYHENWGQGAHTKMAKKHL